MATEKRLIDANALSKSIKEGSGTELQKFFADVCVATAPTVDAVKVVHGHWEWHGGDDDFMTYGFCSNCHNGYEEDLAMVYKFCPNCGAKMDGDGNDI